MVTECDELSAGSDTLGGPDHQLFVLRPSTSSGWGVSEPREQPVSQTDKPARLLTAQNGFVLHITPRVKPKEVKMAKSAGPHLIYGISYVHPVPMPLTLSN